MCFLMMASFRVATGLELLARMLQDVANNYLESSPTVCRQ
jgi:hypothetical protein